MWECSLGKEGSGAELVRKLELMLGAKRFRQTSGEIELMGMVFGGFA